MIAFMCTDPGSCDGLIWVLLAFGAVAVLLFALALAAWVELGAEIIACRRTDLGPWPRRLLSMAALGTLTLLATITTGTATSDWISLPGLIAPLAAIGALVLKVDRRRRRPGPGTLTARRAARDAGR